MCGILALVRPSDVVASTSAVARATRLVRHRGPDDEGFLLWTRALGVQLFAGPDTSAKSRRAHGLAMLPETARWQVAFGHRRLSIVDLSAGGHQPMVHHATGLAIIYNGEIYNHVELRHELVSRGHVFRSHSDTEVLLTAWVEWGPASLGRLNGMFAFVVLDPRNGGTVHAVRDRFGVKPLYYARVGGALAFASEIKQLRSLPGFASGLDESVVRDYLVEGVLDATAHTFDRSVRQVLGGEHATVRLEEGGVGPQLTRWYDLKPRPLEGGLAEASVLVRDLLMDSVRLRLRADVPVGSCLSGGLDSSAIVCLARRCLEAEGDHQGQVTVTARFDLPRYDEWEYAFDVVRAADTQSVEVWPTVERLQSELDQQLWMMDEPFGSTSQFSQWCVFAAAADAGLKVMLDGQGSDEQLAGYGGNDTALYTGLLRRMALPALAAELATFRRRHGTFPIAQLLLSLRNVVPALDALLPNRLRPSRAPPDWLALDVASRLATDPPRDLQHSLLRQTLSVSLPVLLRYEDRNSMAWSIESRVPFLDYRLVELLAGLPDDVKLRRGVTKVVLRDALKGVIPESVRTRTDKMGFVTPEEPWLRQSARGWFRQGVEEAIETCPQLFHGDRLVKIVDDMIVGQTSFSFLPWRILCLGRWVDRQNGERRLQSPEPLPAA